MKIRIDKFLSDMQVATRSESHQLIRSKKVFVNDQCVKSISQKVDPEKDKVCIRHQPIVYQKYFYWLMNKPADVISATTDHHQATVLDLLTDNDYRSDLFPVGRLDKDTTGLLLLTNDGQLAHNLLSPRHHVDKVYHALVQGHVTAKTIAQFKQGLRVDDHFTARPATLQLLNYDDVNDQSYIALTIREGKFHQVKRMFQAVGMHVLTLERVAMGPLTLGDLPQGEYRQLTPTELAVIKH